MKEPTTPTSLAASGQAAGHERSVRLRSAVAHAAESVLRQQSPDGLWRSLYEGGPVHVAAGIIATQLLERPSVARFELEKTLLRGLLDAQDASGAWAAYPEGPLSRDTTRITLLALQLFSERAEARTPSDDALYAELSRALQRGHAYVKREGSAPRSVFLDLLADVFWDAAYPSRSRELVRHPFSAEAAEVFLRSTWTETVRNRISSFSRQAIPAIAILHEKAATRSTWVRLFDWMASLTGKNRSPAALRFLERELLNLQAKTGGWLWSILGTALNLLALHALGKDARHPAVRRGLDFIHSLRMPGTDGEVRQSWCNAELWDSAVAASTLLFCGLGAERFGAEALASHFVREQASDQLWAFGVGALEGDNDSAAVVLATLCRMKAALPVHVQSSVHASIERCVDALLSSQQADGGWGYSPEPHEAPYSFGARSPFGLETTLIDGSTPDVTGRVLAGLLSARAQGLLDEARERRFREGWERAMAYLQASQTDVGAWQGRWTAGHLSPLVFILPVLRAGGVDMSATWIRRAVDFVRRTQNPDGGWGESTSADAEPALAGRGPSTPVQTGYALSALVASAPDTAALQCDGALHQAVDYLLDTQVLGAWHNRRALYTVAFREDYFDASLMTQSLVLCALRHFECAWEAGPHEACSMLVTGRGIESEGGTA